MKKLCYVTAGVASRDDVGALGLRGRCHEDGVGFRASGSCLRHLRLGETAVEPVEDRAVRRHSFLHGVLPNCQSGGHGAGRPPVQVRRPTTGRLRLRHVGGGLPEPELREGGDDRLLRPGQGDRAEKHLQEVRPVRIRLVHRPYVRLKPAGQSTDLSPLPPCA